MQNSTLPSHSMLIGTQAVSVYWTKELIDKLSQILDSKVTWEFPNVYLIKIPPEGEFSQSTELPESVQNFIFSQEMSLVEEQFETKIKFDSYWFHTLFCFKWHGVVYSI